VPAYAYAILIAGIVAWFTPFVFAHRKATSAKTVDKRSRWGVLLQFGAFTLLWQGHFWTRHLAPWRLIICLVSFGLAILLSRGSSRALGEHLRVDAALGVDHRLIRSGPYALVRNPIYTSMLLVICAVAVVIAPWPLFVGSLVLFVLGTEIRVRTEEVLLEERFGEEFQDYKKSVPAYIPFLY
jgi:protein-S-isoprenylcysteine O-methyltransferase Ste14